MYKFIKSIPNAITSMNLLSGTIAATFALKGEINTAIFFVLLSAVFDFLDGFAAKQLRAVSEFGKQLDSLADIVSFGFAPAAMLYFFIENNSILPQYISLLSMLIVVFSALRLAKFNIDTEQSVEFKGLPTPASAMFLISLCGYCENNSGIFVEFIKNPYIIIILIIIICILMVSNIRLFSLKIRTFNLTENLWQVILIISSIILLIIFKILGISLIIILYFSLSILKQKLSKKR